MTRLSHPYTLKITGDPAAFIACAVDRKSFLYLIERLFSGEEVVLAEFDSWGIRVTVVDEFVEVGRIGDE